MSEALYTTYRPHTFADVIGQDHITTPLKESIEKGKTTHAYLFSGSRGTGKTSIARIFARELGTHQHDLYEIDAASHTGVDTIRELLESVHTLPYQSQYKVYIFDEVHMLSKSAFNALLKTLEEPPKHVRFILATTEPERIPDTVRSRCEAYAFRMPSQDVLAGVVARIAKNEKAKLEKGVAELVALAGNGSFRDTLSVLQKIIRTAGEGTITRDEVATITGLPNTVHALEVITALAVHDVSAITTILDTLVEEQKNLRIFTELITERMRAGLLIRLASFNAQQSALSDDEVSALTALVSQTPALFTSRNLVTLLGAHGMNGTALMPQLPLELALIDIAEGLKK